MEPKKMSPEELALTRRDAALPLEYQSPGDDERGRLLAHIAALEAERDEVERMRSHWEWQAKLRGEEMTALRERVRALEELAAAAELGKENAERHLAAIRQRATPVAIETVLSEWHMASREVKAMRVSESILGEDATGAGCVNQQPLSPESRGHLEQIARSAAHHVRTLAATEAPASPEPSTSEAFATLRRARFAPQGAPMEDEFEPALSLLERRMGAMGRAAREVLDAGMGVSDGGLRAHQSLRAALTDAPRVFTEGEVMTVAHDFRPSGENDDPEAWKKQFREALAALRKG